MISVLPLGMNIILVTRNLQHFRRYSKIIEPKLPREL